MARISSTERQYTRLDAVRALLDEIIQGMGDEHAKRAAYVHLYGVGQAAALLALKRGHGRETAELAEIAGMLHDLRKYADPASDTDDHAHICAEFAREKVLDRLDCFTPEEKDLIFRGIYCHSDKNEAGTPFEEIIKDADSAQHTLRNPMEDYFWHKERIQRVLNELILP